MNSYLLAINLLIILNSSQVSILIRALLPIRKNDTRSNFKKNIVESPRVNTFDTAKSAIPNVFGAQFNEWKRCFMAFSIYLSQAVLIMYSIFFWSTSSSNSLLIRLSLLCLVQQIFSLLLSSAFTLVFFCFTYVLSGSRLAFSARIILRPNLVARTDF